MITKLEIKNYRSLRYVDVDLDTFHVLVGPNASGKTTFLDSIAFLGDIVENGPQPAIEQRSNNFSDLVFMHKDENIELAIEARIPDEIVKATNLRFAIIRYEISIGHQKDINEVGIFDERVILKGIENEVNEPAQSYQISVFPETRNIPKTILSNLHSSNARTVVSKKFGANDNFYSEVNPQSGKGWMPSFRLGPKRSALSNLPEDETKFPASTWLKNLLSNGVQQFILNSQAIRKASPPGYGRAFKTDGSNLPWVINDLKTKSPEKFNDWISHLQTALEDIKDIRTVEREDDKHRYLIIDYIGGLSVPSWMVSDGTLRLLALTLPAYLVDFTGIYLIEEPENGIHPKAVETVVQSLSSVYDAQILMATHSPVVLSVVKAEDILCFAKASDGAADIIRGDLHPDLRDWRGQPNLGELFASGVLG